MTHPNNICPCIGNSKHWGINEHQMCKLFSLSVPCESNQLRLKMSRYPFNKADAIKLYVSCSADQAFGISEDYIKGLLFEARTLIMSLQKPQLPLFTMHFSENPTIVHKERISVPSFCLSE